MGDVVSAETSATATLAPRALPGFLDMKSLGFPVVETATPLFNELPMQLFPAEPRVPFVTVSCCTGTASAAQELVTRTAGAGDMEKPLSRTSHNCTTCRSANARISNIVTDRDTTTWKLKRPPSRHRKRRWTDRPPLNFGFSPCPPTPSLLTRWCTVWSLGHVSCPYRRVEALNACAECREADVTKISIAAYNRIRDRYALLRSGGAAGFASARSSSPHSAASVAGLPFLASARQLRCC